jgi:hypothetical protein
VTHAWEKSRRSDPCMLKGLFLRAKWHHILICFTLQKQSKTEHCFFGFELVLLALIVETGGRAKHIEGARRHSSL